MPKIESSAGEMNMTVEESDSKDGNLIFSGKLGVYEVGGDDFADMPIWMGSAQRTVDMDFKICLTPEETRGLMRLFFKPAVLGFLMLLPFRMIAGIFKRKL